MDSDYDNSKIIKGMKTLKDGSFSRYTKVYLLRNKDEAYDKFLLYKAEVENQLDRKIKRMAKLYAPETGIAMTVYSDLCGLQVYSGNFLNGEIGKGGAVYKERSGICFETQFYPNSCNEKAFPSCVFKAGEVFETITVYKFFS